jgi:hypothetical protein
MVSANHSVFRNESETKDEANVATTGENEIQDDEVAEGGYYTVPPLEKVSSTASVSSFSVFRKGYGSISFKVPVDIVDISSLSMLREIIEINRGQISVYKDKVKNANTFETFDVPAEITFENYHPPPDIDHEEFKEQLQSRPDTEFISYVSGTWTFAVQKFSSCYSSQSGYFS